MLVRLAGVQNEERINPAEIINFFADQILFGGAFRARLQSLVEGLLKRAEDKIAPKVIETVAVKVD